MLVTIRPGQKIYVDSWRGYKWSRLAEPSEFDREFFGDRITARIPSGNYTDIVYAIKIDITGRKILFESGEWKVRIKITWLTDDGQDQETSGGYLYLGYDDFS